MNDHTMACLQGELSRQGLHSCAPDGRDGVPENTVAEAARAMAARAHAVLGMDASQVARSIEGAWRAWRAYCGVKLREAPYFSGFLNSCEFGPRGELSSVCLENRYYPKWAPNMDSPIGPMGSGEEYGGIRALPPAFADVPALSVDLSDNFELDPATLMNLSADIRSVCLDNVGLGGDRRLPEGFAARFTSLEKAVLSFNPDGWADAVRRLPASVRSLSLFGCRVRQLPGDLADLLPALEELDVSGMEFSPSVKLPRVPSLHKLVVTDAIPEGLAEAFPSLESVTVSNYCEFDARQLERLPETVRVFSIPALKGAFPQTCAGGEHFGIRELSLGKTVLSDAQFMALPPSLERLSGCFLAGEEIPEGAAQRFPNLASFSAFPKGKFSSASIARLPASTRAIAAVQRGWTEIPDVFSGHLSGVRSVDTHQNPIDPATLLRLPRELRDLTCSGGPNRGESFHGRFAFPAGFKDRCPFVESIDAAHHADFDLDSLANVAPTLRRLRLAWCGKLPLVLPAGLTDWFPLLEQIDLCGVAGGEMSPALAEKVAKGEVRILSYER